MATLMTSPKGLPVLVMGDIGLSLDALSEALKVHIKISSKSQLRKTNSAMDAFQELVIREGGAFLLRVEDKATLEGFIRSFQLSIQKLNLQRTKIIIFSTRDEIILSRVLTQFPFISIINPRAEGKNLSTAVANASNLFSRPIDEKPKSGLSSKIVVIKGPQKFGHVHAIGDKQPPGNGKTYTTQTNPSENDSIVDVSDSEKESVLASCIGEQIPTFVYDPTLAWRVKGHFTKLDSNASAITFQVAQQDGADKINEAIKVYGTMFLSSSSTSDSRVCSSLEFIENSGLDFKFKMPEQMREVQRRANPRGKITPDDNPAFIQFLNENTKSEEMLAVLDISLNGIGVRIDKDLVDNFTVGQVLRNVVLILAKRTIKVPHAEVRHSSRPETANPNFKILGLSTSGISETDASFIEMFVVSQSTAN